MFQVQCQVEGVVWEFQYFILYYVGQIMDMVDIVGYGDDCVLIVNFSGIVKVLDLVFDQFVDFRCVELYINF